MRRAALILLLSACALPQSTFDDRLARFHEHYDRFVREYLGCPPRAREVEECRPRQGRFDLKEWKAAAKEARALFAE